MQVSVHNCAEKIFIDSKNNPMANLVLNPMKLPLRTTLKIYHGRSLVKLCWLHFSTRIYYLRTWILSWKIVTELSTALQIQWQTHVLFCWSCSVYKHRKYCVCQHNVWWWSKDIQMEWLMDRKRKTSWSYKIVAIRKG